MWVFGYLVWVAWIAFFLWGWHDRFAIYRACPVSAFFEFSEGRFPRIRGYLSIVKWWFGG